MDLSSFAVSGLNEVYYIPDFVTEHEEQYLIRKASTVWFTLTILTTS
jgi:alkylated DNA repair protein alkB homolog 6